MGVFTADFALSALGPSLVDSLCAGGLLGSEETLFFEPSLQFGLRMGSGGRAWSSVVVCGLGSKEEAGVLLEEAVSGRQLQAEPWRLGFSGCSIPATFLHIFFF